MNCRTRIRTTLLALLLVTAGAMAAPNPLQAGTAVIGGSIFTGANDGAGPVLAPNALTPPITDARVMVQNMHSGGAFIAYASVTGNTWTATVNAPTAPDVAEYIVMFSALDHDTTSREFIVSAGDNKSADAYLPTLPLPLANLLVYAFYDNAVNGEDDLPDDPALAGVTFTVKDEHGALLATGVTGSQSPFTTIDGIVISDTTGYYYFRDLPPGEVVITSSASTVHLSTNPGFSFDATTEFYLTTSEEGGPAWDPKLYPGDPGTDAGTYLIWHGYVEKLGQFPAGAPFNGRIYGRLFDSDSGTDPAEPLHTWCHPGVSANDVVPDAYIVLFSDAETVPVHPVATTEPDPVTGIYEFVNVPPGSYKLFVSDIPIDYVWVLAQVNVAPNSDNPVYPLVPRFFARAHGTVRDDSTGDPIAGAAVHIRLKDGSIWKTQITDASGWYNFDDLAEVEVLGHVDVELPPGFHGAMKTDSFFVDPITGGCDLLGNYSVTHNAMNRYIQWYTANYQADLFIEPIPAGSGDLRGFVYNDHFARGSWTADGVYDPDEERTFHGVTIELWDASGTTLLDTTTTGEFDQAATAAQGWAQPYTWRVPPDEWGGVYTGSLPGYFEFRGVAPGDYLAKVILPPGFAPSPAASDVVPITIASAAAVEIDFGMNTTPPGSAFGVPLAGEIEGGVFDDINIDANPFSLLFLEKAGIAGTPVGVYDHLGYMLGAGNMGNPLCYAGSTQCPAGEDPQQKPEMERRFAPGVHIFVGNDPALPGYNPNYLPLSLGYEFGQGKYKFEADWSLVPVAFGGLGRPMLANLQIIADNRPAVDIPMSPAPVASGAILTVTGQNFGHKRAYSTVSLSGKRLRIRRWSDTSIDVVIPLDALSGPLLVATSTGISNGLPVEIASWWPFTDYMAVRTIFVDADNTGFEDGSQVFPWRTIGAALEHLPAAAPRFVFVAAGTYHERVQIKESYVRIIGAGPLETTVDGLGPATLATQGVVGAGPVFFIGKGGETGGVTGVTISGFTITRGTVKDEIGAGIFGDYGNRRLDINNNIIVRNGGYYGGGIWFHHSTHDVMIWSNVIAENGNFGGYGGGISVNDEPEYGEEHGQPEHIGDDANPGPPPGKYTIFNNLIFHNYSVDYGGGICLYETKDRLRIFGNMLLENKAEDHGGALFLEDTGPASIYGNVFLRNYSPDDGGAISLEDVGDHISRIRIHDNLFAENIADDRGENHARGGALAIDDTFDVRVYNNTFVGNIAAGSLNPAGAAIDSERNGHEYNGESGPYVAPGFSDPKIYNNIIYGNWRLNYDQPSTLGGGEEEDLDYTWGINYRWTPGAIHVDNPWLQGEWESHNNSESLSWVRYNDIEGGYASGTGNIDVDPLFADPTSLNWRLSAGSPVIDRAPAAGASRRDLERLRRRARSGMVDMGAFEFGRRGRIVMRIPEGILGLIQMPIPGSTSLD